MSNLIEFTEKRIFANKPNSGNYGQYNYGRVEVGTNFGNLGGYQNNTALHLWTRVWNEENTNLSNYPSGYPYMRGSSIKVNYVSTEVQTHHITKCKSSSTTWVSSQYPIGSVYRNVGISLYIIDGATSVGTDVGQGDYGNDIRTALNSISYISKYDVGNQPYLESILDGENITSDLPDWTGENKIIDVGTNNPKYYNNGTLQSTQTNWFGNSNNFLQGILTPNALDASRIYVVAKAEGKVKIRTGHNPGLDARDNVWAKMIINKSELSEIFMRSLGEKIIFQKTFETDSLHTARQQLGWQSDHVYRDSSGNAGVPNQSYTTSHGSHSGAQFGNHSHTYQYDLDFNYCHPSYSDPPTGHDITPGDEWPTNTIKDMEVEITAPNYTIEGAMESINHGGYDANWVEKEHLCNPTDDLEPYGVEWIPGANPEDNPYNLISACDGNGVCSEEDFQQYPDGVNPNCVDASVGDIIPYGSVCTDGTHGNQYECGTGGKCIQVLNQQAMGAPSVGCGCTAYDFDNSLWECDVDNEFGAGIRPMSNEEMIEAAAASGGDTSGLVNIPKLAIGKTLDREGWHCYDAFQSQAEYGITNENSLVDTLRAGLHPRYKMDFNGFPNNDCVGDSSCHQHRNEQDCKTQTYYDELSGRNIHCSWLNFYNDDIQDGWFKGGYLPDDTRPISSVSGSFGVDVQSYYNGSSLNQFRIRALTSAPNNVYLSFRMSKTFENSMPQYIDLIDRGLEENLGAEGTETNTFKYKNNEEHNHAIDWWYFVVTWNRNSTLGEPSNLTGWMSKFPQNITELNGYENRGLFGLKKINELSQHQYKTPGRKEIHAIVFSTVKNYFRDGDDNFKFPGYVQAINWKLVKMKININSENIGSMMPRDFEDVGGDNFVYIPYPELIPLNAYHKDGRHIHGFAPSGGTYKTSHIVISGLSPNSSYANSLNKVLMEDKFSENEVTPKAFAQRAKELGPDGVLNEVGNYIGRSDISQIRLFNKSLLVEGEDGNNPYYKQLDMHTLLGIDREVAIDTTGNDIADYETEFHPYWDTYQSWGCNDFAGDRNDCFPLESPVGNLFIGEYDQYKNICLFEIQSDILSEKSFRDTSGNNVKGHLIGDYSIKKEDKNQATARDSHIKVSKVEVATNHKKNGAF